MTDYKGKVFYAVLNMGLGHATRSLPVIQEFLRRGWKVWVGSNGRSLQFLKHELPDADFITTPDYGITYSHGSLLLPKLISQTPGVLFKIREEKKLCDRIVEGIVPDLIVSDHCYGMHHSQIPSYFMSHQIYFALPAYLQPFSPLISQFNFGFHNRYRKVLIPDLPENGHGLISGKLSNLPSSDKHHKFIGTLSSIKRQSHGNDIDVLFSVSGPEPQRSVFEKIILAQVRDVKGKKIVALGKSEERKLLEDEDDLKVYTHLPRMEMETLFNRAKLIVTRAGYSTLMELAETGKKALLVPTPGQTEQEYLAKRMIEKKWFYSVSQNHINLSRDIEIAQLTTGLSKPDATQNTVDHIFNEVLKI